LDISEGFHVGDQLTRHMKGWSARGFDALKIARYQVAENRLQLLRDAIGDDAMQGDQGRAAMELLARDVNYATGSVMEARGAAASKFDRLAASMSGASGNILLASKLFYARRMGGIVTPLRYMAQYLTKGGRMTPVERGIANIALRKWARIVATQASIVGVNYGIAKALGLQTPNVSDPSRADFMRLRIGNFVVPLSPLWEILKEPLRAVYTGVQKQSVAEGLKIIPETIIKSLHPSATIVGEQVTGKETFGLHRPVPSVPMALGYPKKSNVPSVSLTEYLGNKIPIAVGGMVHEFYQVLRDEGVPASQASAITKWMIGGAKVAASGITSGLAGTHIYEDTSENVPKTKKGYRRPPPQAVRRRNAQFKLIEP